MKYFISIIEFFIRIKFNFNNPKKSKIILFDDETHGVMKNVLDDYKYFLLKSGFGRFIYPTTFNLVCTPFVYSFKESFFFIWEIIAVSSI